MIPEFNDDGYLPVGIHSATLDQIAERFGTESELRQAQMQSLRWLVELAWKAGVLRIVVNGSFASSAYEPNDVDCVLLFDESYPTDAVADAELQTGLPFIQGGLALRDTFDYFVDEYFCTNRFGVPKGMIEVIR